jgi:hypothetical protein
VAQGSLCTAPGASGSVSSTEMGKGRTECFENGLITRQDTDGLDLRFGSADALLAMTKKIARRAADRDWQGEWN